MLSVPDSGCTGCGKVKVRLRWLREMIVQIGTASLSRKRRSSHARDLWGNSEFEAHPRSWYITTEFPKGSGQSRRYAGLPQLESVHGISLPGLSPSQKLAAPPRHNRKFRALLFLGRL